MKIGIHHRIGSFSELWIQYCIEKKINYKLVNCYDNDIILQLQDCDALMWHFQHCVYPEVIFAKHLFYTLEMIGLKVFPDINSCWHFDDKVSQKYLLEALQVPFVNTSLFYNIKDAKKYLVGCNYPIVAKLSSGAGSSNVFLLKNYRNAKRFSKRIINKGIKKFSGWRYFIDRLKKYLGGKDSLYGVLKGFARVFISTRYSKMSGKEIGYTYFQEYLPNNTFDIRVIVIYGKAFAIKRMVRKYDFRASGSGDIIYNKEAIDTRCVKIAFETSKRLRANCLAYDFIFDVGNNPLIVEISYGFSPSGYFDCVGYWDNEMHWYEGGFNPYGWMIDGLIQDIGPWRV